MEQGTARPLRILLVEDDPEASAGLGALLRADGHRVHLAGDSLTAIGMIKDGGLDVALVDLRLPPPPGLGGRTLSGWDLIRIHRAFAPEVAVIVVSADLGPETWARARELAVRRCLAKPVDLALLRECLRELAPGARAAAPQAAEGGCRP